MPCHSCKTMHICAAATQGFSVQHKRYGARRWEEGPTHLEEAAALDDMLQQYKKGAAKRYRVLAHMSYPHDPRVLCGLSRRD